MFIYVLHNDIQFSVSMIILGIKIVNLGHQLKRAIVTIITEEFVMKFAI